MSYRRWNDVVCLLGSECCYWDDLKDAELFWLLFNDVWLDPLFHNFLIHWPKNELWSNFSCNCVWRSWMFLNFCHYQPPRGVFRDLSNIYDEVFCEDRCFWTFFTKKYFCKKIYHRCLIRVLNMPLPLFCLFNKRKSVNDNVNCGYFIVSFCVILPFLLLHLDQQW